APQAMQFSFKELFACYFRCSNCLVEQIEASLRLAEARVSRCEMAKIQGAAVPFSAALRPPPSLSPQFGSQVGITAFGRPRPPQKERCLVRWTGEPVPGGGGSPFMRGGGARWRFTTKGAEDPRGAKSNRGQMREPHRLCTRKSLSRRCSGLLRIAEEQECRG